MASLGSTSTSTFNGTSVYASQLQNVITIAVNNASAPMQQLQTQETSLSQEQSEIETLQNDFGSLQTAVSSLSDATGQASFTANVSDSSVLSASVSSGAMPGTYNITVGKIGSQTNTLSQAGSTPVSDPGSGNISGSDAFTLTVNGKSYQIADAAGTLSGLAQAISNSSAPVQATVVNLGSSTAPDYRLSVQGLGYEPDTIQLNDGKKDLLSTISPGAYTTYQINGEPSIPINTSSQTVTISPGLSVQLLQAGTSSVTVSQSTDGISSALSSFASAYNSISAELTKNRGQNGGALSGQSLVYDLQNQLQTLATYSSGNGDINSLASLGLTFDQSGNLQFDASTFASAAGSVSSSDLLNFLGSPTTGGFLEAATNALSSATDPTTGSLTQASNSASQQISDIQTKVTNDQAQVATLQQTLTTQMATADATISSIQQQVTEITNLFSDMQTNSRAENG